MSDTYVVEGDGVVPLTINTEPVSTVDGMPADDSGTSSKGLRADIA